MGTNKKRSVDNGFIPKKLRIYAFAVVTVLLAVLLLGEINSLQLALTPVGLYHLKGDEFSKLRLERVGCIAGYIVLVSFSISYIVGGQILGERIKKLVLLIHSTVCTLLFLEGVFMFIPKSAGDNQLSQIIWMNRFWKVYVPVFDLRNRPMNLREIPTTAKSPVGNGTTVFVVGDSFGAGDGIDNPDSIFSTILYQKIVAKDKLPCKMVNICERGDGPEREYDNMVTYSNGSAIVPNIVVWQYYGNDIEEFAQSRGNSFVSAPLPELVKFAKSFLERKSFLGDYIFWNSIPMDPNNDYLNYLEGLYRDSVSMVGHVDPIIRAAQWCSEHHATFVVVIFPILTEPDWSNKVYATPLSKKFAAANISFINLSDSVKDIPVKERIVNSRNIHPGKRVHARAADAIFEFLTSNKPGI